MADRPTPPPLTKWLEPLEQRLTYAAAVYTALATLVVTVPYLSGSHPKLKGSPALALGIGLGSAAVVLVGARLRHRLGAALAAGLAGVAPWGGILSVPVLGLSFWLLFRNSRRMREERGLAPAPARGERPAGFRRRRPTAEADDGKRRPPASKRYTPPKAPDKGGRGGRRRG
ncbi:MAG TPA: hypothetical protein VE990_18930 [Acidimicrobiales bacterium]|nr:hypothetical protein [Acidimicrobiales bacterium]